MTDELCPDSVPRNVPTRAWFSGHSQARTPDRPCLPARRRPQVHLVREVPAAGRPAGPEAHRAGVDRARAPSDGPLHEAHRGSLVARRARRGATRDAARPRADQRDVRRRRRGVPAVRRARSRDQALDADRLPLDRLRPPRARLWRDARRGGHPGENRALACDCDLGPTARRCPTAPRTSCSSCSTASSAAPRRCTGCQATPSRGSSATRSARAATSRSSASKRSTRLCARPPPTGRHHLPHRRLHRAASRRARRCAGATSTSPPRPSASVRATPGAR